MKKIIVFGATGGTGKEIVKQALEKGYEVTAIARNPSDLDFDHSHLKIIKGDVLQPFTFEKELQGKQVVISCLGTGQSTKPTMIYSEGIKNIFSAMNKTEVKRLICISAGALDANREMGFFISTLTKVVLQRILRNVYSDMRLMEKQVESSNVDWTIVRPAMLKNKSLTGEYRIAINAHIRRPFSISRADLAHYILSNIENSQTFRTKVEIAY